MAGEHRLHPVLAELGEEQMQRITFLMDFEGASDAGDVDSTVPPSDKE